MNPPQPAPHEVGRDVETSNDSPLGDPRIAIALTLLAVIAVAAVVLAAQGLVNNFRGTSNLEGASQLTTTVNTGSIENRITGTVTVKPEYEIVVRSPHTAGTEAVVTTDGLAAGAKVEPGDVVVAVAGRPVIALSGDLPSYRELAPGMTGPDVAQLQNALELLGYEIRDPTGTFGSWTARAVSALYRDRGFEAIGPTGTSAWTSVRVPIAEVVFVPQFPAHAIGACGSRGRIAVSPVCVLRAGASRVVVSLSRFEAQRTQLGHVVDISLSNGESIIGTLYHELPDESGSLGTGSIIEGDSGATSPHPRRFLVELGQPLPSGLDGTTGSASLLISATGPGSLTVAQTAIRVDATGVSWLERLVDETQERERVVIEVQLCSGGLCAFTGSISPGSTVALNIASRSG